MIRKTLAVASKELHQILRDRRTLMILLFIPAFFLLLYGYALNFDIRNVRLAVQDRDRSSKSRELVSSFVNSGYFELVGYVDSDQEIERLIDRNGARVVISIPPGFERDLALGRPAVVQVVIDGDNANTAATVAGYARLLIGEYNGAQMTVRPAALIAIAAPRAGSWCRRSWTPATSRWSDTSIQTPRSSG